MLSRREFHRAALASLGGLGLTACSQVLGTDDYAQAVAATWRHGASELGGEPLLHELVRYATLAPSSHNTQCWKFHTSAQQISILADLTRRCPVVDPDDHHLFISLGCAAENLAQAALAHGFKAHVAFDSHDGAALRIALEPTRALSTPSFQAIPARQSTRGEYDHQPLAPQELKALSTAAAGAGVQLILLTEAQAMENVLEYVAQGNSAQMNSPAFVAELKAWLRFNGADAARSGDGLYAACSGNPSLPAWLARPLFNLFFTPGSENDKYAKQIRSSAGIAVFASADKGRPQWVEVGRSYERFALAATAMGVRCAFLNQPVEVAALRPQFAGFLGLGTLRPDLVVRFGRGPRLPPSLRRPLSRVLV